MPFPRLTCLILAASFAIFSTGCGFSIWPWGKRDNYAASQTERETKEEKSVRLVREACDAAVAVRRSDLLELEGAAIVGALGGGADASARIANRASSAARTSSVVYVAALGKLSKLPRGLVEAEISRFTYQDSEKQKLLESLKPVIRRNLHETRLGLKPTPEACLQDLQSVRYAP